jgi:hypothetical protein
MRSRQAQRELACWPWPTRLKRKSSTPALTTSSDAVVATSSTSTHDGVTDLSFQNTFRTVSCTVDGGCNHVEQLSAKLAANNEVVYNVFGAVAMKAGMRIGPKRTFRGGVEMMASIGTIASRGPNGSWINVKNRYLGIKFKINGETHFGWARLSVQANRFPSITATLTGYAYETVPNKPIIAGKTKGADESYDSISQPEAALSVPTPRSATLGLLAMGSSGLSIWRREELVGVV